MVIILASTVRVNFMLDEIFTSPLFTTPVEALLRLGTVALWFLPQSAPQV
jgi:hypothetical protein